MQWSKLRQQIKSRFADSVADRVDLHSAIYRWHHEADGRIWLTVDGEEVANFCTQTYWNEVAPNSDDARDEAVPKGLMSRGQAYGQLEDYLNLSVEDALSSGSPLQRALAILDRRLGKRRLPDVEPADGAPGFVRVLWTLRMDAEGLVRQPDD